MMNEHDIYHPPAPKRRPFYKTKWCLLGSIVALIVIVVVAVTVSSKNKSSSESRTAPDIEVSNAEFQSNKNEFGSALVALYDKLGVQWDVVGDNTSPQGKAMTFVAGSKLYSTIGRARNVQRYALAVFYHSTYQQPHAYLPSASPWKSSDNWMTSAFECTWEGIVCNDNNLVTGILLEDKGVSGMLPIELAFLEALETLDLTTNLIYMAEDHHDVFSHLTTLRHLVLDDNFIYTEDGGLPEQFEKMVNLEKISMSYNLLQGQLAGSLFASVPKLSHLEVESNYLSGTLPTELLTLDNLIYAYLRRNGFAFALADIMQPGYLPAIFALWLDSNEITGPIPTQIGQLTELASFSATNSSLSGPIPTEMGLLVNMKRCWLYDNKELSGPIPAELAAWTDLQVFEVQGTAVTGTMPQAVCTAVGNSEYQFATLAANCDNVACTDCCTQCY